MSPLVMSHAHYEQVVRHCQEEWPKEACGILAGRGGRALVGAERVVAQVYLMTNVEGSPIGYAMDPKEQLRLERTLRSRGQAMLGIYHSHTGSDAYPSLVDVSLSISPDLSYVLVSLKDRSRPVVKSYRIDGQAIQPEALALDPAPPGTGSMVTG